MKFLRLTDLLSRPSLTTALFLIVSVYSINGTSIDHLHLFCSAIVQEQKIHPDCRLMISSVETGEVQQRTQFDFLFLFQHPSHGRMKDQPVSANLLYEQHPKNWNKPTAVKLLETSTPQVQIDGHS